MKAPSRRFWWLMVAAWGALLADLILHPEHFRLFGVNHYDVWFLDTLALLASNDALAHGLDVYANNPLDYFGRPHVYPHWWLWLGKLGLTRADAAWLGFTFGAAFFVAAVARLRPRNAGETAWFLAALCSPAVLLALDRANNDLVIFVLLTPVVPCLLARRAAVRALAIPLIAAATALKTYPAVAACVLLAVGSPREVRWRIGAMLAVFAVMSFDLVRDFQHYGAIVPRPEGLMTFGAANLFTLLGAGGTLAQALAVALGGIIALAVLRWDPLDKWQISPELRVSWLGFVLGAVVLTGCFFAGRSFGYRWIFALWMLPLLGRLPWEAQAPAVVRRLAAVTAGLVLLALWMDGMASTVLLRYAKALGGVRITRLADGYFLAEQPFTWALFTCLMVFLLHFVRQGVRGLRGTASAG